MASFIIGYCQIEEGVPPFVFITIGSADFNDPTSSPDVLQSSLGIAANSNRISFKSFWF